MEEITCILRFWKQSIQLKMHVCLYKNDLLQDSASVTIAMNILVHFCFDFEVCYVIQVGVHLPSV